MIKKIEMLTSGDAVYSARVLLGINPSQNQTSNRMAQSTHTQQSVAGKIYPNPAHDVAYLNYTLEDGQNAKIYFFNLMGAPIETFTIKNCENRFEFSTKNFKSGLYFYNIVLDNGRLLESNKLIIIK